MKNLEDIRKSVIDEHLEKAGEGSRGGHVIGHTKSGKPIYSHYSHPSHKTFTNDEHIEAANAHLNVMKQVHSRGHGAGDTNIKEKDRSNVAMHHSIQAQNHGNHKHIKAGKIKEYVPEQKEWQNPYKKE